MADDDALHLLLPILERRAYARRVRDGEGAAMLAAIANLPIGWLRRLRAVDLESVRGLDEYRQATSR